MIALLAAVAIAWPPPIAWHAPPPLKRPAFAVSPAITRPAFAAPPASEWAHILSQYRPLESPELELVSRGSAVPR